MTSKKAILLPQNNYVSNLPMLASRDQKQGYVRRPYLSVHSPCLAPLAPLDRRNSDIEDNEVNIIAPTFNFPRSSSSNDFEVANGLTFNQTQPNEKFNVSYKAESQNCVPPVLNTQIPTYQFNSLPTRSPAPPETIALQAPVLFTKKEVEKPQNTFQPPVIPKVVESGKPTNPFLYEKSPMPLKQVAQSGQGYTVFAFLIDPEVPCILKYCACKGVTQQSIDLSVIPALPGYEDSSFDRILSQKIQACSLILDFTVPNFQVSEKESKGRFLCEFIELFENTRKVKTLSPQQQQSIFKMLYNNIFNQETFLPHNFLCHYGIQLDPTLTFIEPSWPHLFYCYQILNRYAQIFPEQITLATFKTALKMTLVPDANERMQLVAFLRTYYDTHQSERSQILKAIQLQISEILSNQSVHFSAISIVILVTHIYSRTQQNLIPELAVWVLNYVAPLLSSPLFPQFSQNLKQLLLNVLNQTYQAERVLRVIEKHWPQANGSKQFAYLDLIISVISKINPEVFKPFANRFFSFLASCVGSPHNGLADLAMDIWTKCSTEQWLIQNSRVGITTMFDNVWRLSELGREKATNALSEMCKQHKSQYHKLKTEMRAQQIKKTKVIHSNKELKAWAYIAKEASYQDKTLNYHQKVHGMKAEWTADRAKWSVVNRFMTGSDPNYLQNVDLSTN